MKEHTSTADKIPIKKCQINAISCATCKFMGWSGKGIFSYCVKLGKRVRGNQKCSKHERRSL